VKPALLALSFFAWILVLIAAPFVVSAHLFGLGKVWEKV
jgi:hypothetical protein